MDRWSVAEPSWVKSAAGPSPAVDDPFEREAVAFVDWLRAGPVAPGFESVLIAGDPERAARAQREVHGIVIDDQTWAELVAAGAKVGVAIATQ